VRRGTDAEVHVRRRKPDLSENRVGQNSHRSAGPVWTSVCRVSGHFRRAAMTGATFHGSWAERRPREAMPLTRPVAWSTPSSVQRELPRCIFHHPRAAVRTEAFSQRLSVRKLCSMAFARASGSFRLGEHSARASSHTKLRADRPSKPQEHGARACHVYRNTLVGVDGGDVRVLCRTAAPMCRRSPARASHPSAGARGTGRWRVPVRPASSRHADAPDRLPPTAMRNVCDGFRSLSACAARDCPPSCLQRQGPPR